MILFNAALRKQFWRKTILDKESLVCAILKNETWHLNEGFEGFGLCASLNILGSEIIKYY